MTEYVNKKTKIFFILCTAITAVFVLLFFVFMEISFADIEEDPPPTGATISWTSTNAVRGQIDNGIGSITPVSGGSVLGLGGEGTTYTATFFAADGTSVQCSATVGAPPGPIPPGAGSCPLGAGACSPANLQGACNWNANEASQVCQGESGSVVNAPSGSDVLRSGHPFSQGLFQINLTVNDVAGLGCPNAFSGEDFSATIVDMDLYNRCITAANNADNNIAAACVLFQGRGGNWEDWTAAHTCNLPTSGSHYAN